MINNSILALRFSPGVDGHTSTSTAATVALPTLANGEKPKYVYVLGDHTTALKMTFGQSGITVAGNGTQIMVGAGIEALIIDVTGMSHYAYDAQSGNLIVSPLESGGGIG